MKKGWFKEDSERETIDDFHDDFYTLDVRERLLEDDEINSWEEGFMNGYEGVV